MPKKTTTETVLDQLMDRAEKRARKFLKKNGEVPKLVFFEKEDGDGAMLRFQAADSVEGRAAQAQSIGSLLRDSGAIAYVVVYEAWMAEIEKHDLPSAPKPSKSPNRIDALLIEGYDNERSQHRIFEVVAKGTKRTLKPYAEEPDEKMPWSAWAGLLNDPSERRVN